MSTNRKYYYLKFKEDYFDQDRIKIIESVENGYIYSLIIIKLYLKSLKHDGRLMMSQTLPYNPNNLEILSNVIHHDIAHVKEAIKVARELDLITILDSGEIWMTEIENFIGSSSTEGDRKRQYRIKLEERGQMSGQTSDERPPEIEIEIEKEIEIEIDKKICKKKKLTEQEIIDFETLFLFWEQNKAGKKYKDDKSRRRMLNRLKELTNGSLTYAKEAILFCIDNRYQGFCSGSELFYKGGLYKTSRKTAFDRNMARLKEGDIKFE